MKKRKDDIAVYTVIASTERETAFADVGIKAGFPSPGQDHIQESIDLNKVIVPHPESTFIVVAPLGTTGENCIEEGNLLVIDQSLSPTNGSLVACYIDGEFLIRTVLFIDGSLKLQSPGSSLIIVTEGTDYTFWGTVIATIRFNQKRYFHSLNYQPVSPLHSLNLPTFVQERIIGNIDLNNILIKNPPTTFITVASGNSMNRDCIEDGNLLIIDKSLDSFDGCLAACYIDGEFTLKRVKIETDTIWLLPSNPEFPPINVTASNTFLIWGIVVSIIRFYQRRPV
ncbi:LexA family protein [Parabacteroides sp.]